jgi:hypothetical protein
MRRVVLVLLALPLAGCGGENGARLDAVRPCLAKMGVVVKGKPPPTPSSPEGDASVAGFDETVVLAFTHPGHGANNVEVVFFHDKGGPAGYERLFDDELHRMGLRPSHPPWPRPPAPNVLLRWWTQPTGAQKRRVAACFA